MGLCRRINSNWERHNDVEKKIHPFSARDYNAKYTPSAYTLGYKIQKIKVIPNEEISTEKQRKL